ncbi:MAG TPA: DUF718 domain-containing protein [Bauldia sp.]|nr:DUF718 domain-containing protein [Bauldia sp.]
MTAFNIVRFRVKPGREQEFLDQHKAFDRTIPGIHKLSMVKTGERSYCLVGEWNAMSDIVAARPAMIANLDKLRPLLEDLGNGLGVTDPVSGDVVLSIK